MKKKGKRLITLLLFWGLISSIDLRTNEIVTNQVDLVADVF